VWLIWLGGVCGGFGDEAEASRVSKFFWPEGGGAELATYLFIKRYLADWFDVVVVSGTDKPIIGRGCCRYVVWDVLRAGFKPAEWLLFAAKLRNVAKLIRWADIVYIPSHTLLPLAPIVKWVNPRARGCTSRAQ